MRIYEEFTRCECGEALIKKEEYVLANYITSVSGSFFQPNGKRIRYTCKKCGKFIHEETITEN